MLRWDVDIFDREERRDRYGRGVGVSGEVGEEGGVWAGEVLEDIGQSGLVEVDVAWGGVFGLFGLMLEDRNTPPEIELIEDIPCFRAAAVFS